MKDDLNSDIEAMLKGGKRELVHVCPPEWRRKFDGTFDCISETGGCVKCNPRLRPEWRAINLDQLP